ncbi:DUF4352 domain-containing protein [bacterium]|nr:DUF4352 domain-containing protein [bacterium]
MFCAKCGSEAPEGAVFCPKCGTQIGEAGASSHESPKKEKPKAKGRSVWFDIWISALIVWTVLCARGCVEGSVAVTDDVAADPFVAAGAAIGMGLLLVVWFLVVTPLGIFALITRPSESRTKPYWLVYGLAGLLSLLILFPTCAGYSNNYLYADLDGTSKDSVVQSSIGLVVGDEVKMTLKGPSTFGYYQYFEESSDYRYLWVPLVLRNEGSQTQHVNPLYFTVQTPEGLTINVSSETYGLDNSLEATNVPPGGSIVGWLIFEVPKGKQYKLIFDDGLFSHTSVDIFL